MLRVTNLDESINFYSHIFGMEILRKKDFPDGKFTLAFLGYGDESSNTVLELTHNWETDSYEMGNAYGHIAIAVDDAYKACAEISAKGGEVVRPAGPMMHGSTVIAFVKDPDGYMIELIQGK
jgi:lactoylglutathione lyase